MTSDNKSKPLLEYLQDLSVFQSWDCYNDCPSEYHYIEVKNVHDKETIQRIIDLLNIVGRK